MWLLMSMGLVHAENTSVEQRDRDYTMEVNLRARQLLIRIVF